MPQKKGLFPKIWKSISRLWKKETNVYFISGMCYNCSVFDDLELPEGFNKHYIEWLIPHVNESLHDYSRRMAESIDTSHPYVLVGYSFGATIMQEMNHFLSPKKSVIISSFKAEDEKPMLFKAVKRGNLSEKIPDMVYNSTELITEAFNYLVYHMPTSELSKYMTITDPAYIKWAVKQITEWTPSKKIENLYHIHGTLDQVFPYNLIKYAFPIENGDHLMVIKKAVNVSIVLDSILLMKD